MNFWAVWRHLGVLLAGFSILPAGGLVFALVRGETAEAKAFALTGAIAAGTGGLLYVLGRRPPGTEPLRRREALFLVPLAWVAGCLLAAIPFVASGQTDWIDGLFEAVSGLTTTGSSIFRDVESLSLGIVLWRAVLQWVGGIGIVVLFVAVFPGLGVGARHMFFAESPGTGHQGFLPRIRSTALRVGAVYLTISILASGVFWLAGMPLIDAVAQMMTGLSTGGHSTRNAGIGAFTGRWVPWVTLLVMTVGGSNLSLYYHKSIGRKRVFTSNPEFKWYIGIMVVASLVLAVDVWRLGSASGFREAITDGAFAAASIQTTTGFATADFDRWSSFSKMVLLLLMFVGGCSGSTSGGFKVVRLVLVTKMAFNEFVRTFNPKKITLLKLGDQSIDSETRDAVMGVLVCSMAVLAISVLLVALFGLDFESAISGVFASVGNVGPGFGALGPMSNYADVPSGAKLVFMIDMLLGRLEFYPVLILFHPGFWRK